MRWELKVFTNSTLEGGHRTKFTTNIINIFVLDNPLPNHQELIYGQIKSNNLRYIPCTKASRNEPH